MTLRTLSAHCTQALVSAPHMCPQTVNDFHVITGTIAASDRDPRWAALALF